jgi:hypothetical protein
MCLSARFGKGKGISGQLTRRARKRIREGGAMQSDSKFYSLMRLSAAEISDKPDAPVACKPMKTTGR